MSCRGCSRKLRAFPWKELETVRAAQNYWLCRLLVGEWPGRRWWWRESKESIRPQATRTVRKRAVPDSPTERRKTERRMTEHWMTERRKTQHRMTERRMTDRMTKLKWLNVEWQRVEKDPTTNDWTSKMTCIFIYNLNLLYTNFKN